VGEADEAMKLRFCTPSESLKPALQKGRLGAGYYMPDTADLEEAIELIEMHVKNFVCAEPAQEEAAHG
jgi:hypothetical protein